MNVVLEFWRSTIGKKVVMALTGIFMVLWILGHVSGNLLVFKGPAAMNQYAAFLHSLGGVLWAVRAVLLVAIVLHALAAWQLTERAHAARPVAYVKKAAQVSTAASLLMRWGGVLLLVYVVFHLLHMTFGVVHPGFSRDDVYRNVVDGLRAPYVAAFYLVAMAALGMHLFHGVWSSARTLGVARPSQAPLERRVAVAVAVIVWAGFSVIPLAVLFGFVS